MSFVQICHIVVNYTNDLETKEFVGRCQAIQGSENVLFVIVNNSALSKTDSQFNSLISETVMVINAPQNPGYFGGAEMALKSLAGKAFKFTILSNSDLEIVTQDFYLRLKEMTFTEKTGAIAPSIFSQMTKAESNPLYQDRPSGRKIKFLKAIYSNFYLAWFYHFASWIKAFFVFEQIILFPEQSVYAPHGCFLILTQSFFENGGSFAYPAKLYGEELFLAETLSAMNLVVLVAPDLKISHREMGTQSGGWFRKILSRRTFEFKKESSQLLAQLFERN